MYDRFATLFLYLRHNTLKSDLRLSSTLDTRDSLILLSKSLHIISQILCKEIMNENKFDSWKFIKLTQEPDVSVHINHYWLVTQILDCLKEECDKEQGKQTTFDAIGKAFTAWKICKAVILQEVKTCFKCDFLNNPNLTCSVARPLSVSWQFSAGTKEKLHKTWVKVLRNHQETLSQDLHTKWKGVSILLIPGINHWQPRFHGKFWTYFVVSKLSFWK